MEKDIAFDKQGSLEFVFRKIKLWKNGEQKSTGRRLPFRRQGRDAIPKGENRKTRRGQDHFRNQAVRVRSCLQSQWLIDRRARAELTAGVTCGAVGQFTVIKVALEHSLMKQWTSAEEATREITEGLEQTGIRGKIPGQIVTSHSGRKTCVSAGMELGVDAAVMKEWMLTASDQTERYRQRGYELNVEVSQLFDFLMKRKP